MSLREFPIFQVVFFFFRICEGLMVIHSDVIWFWAFYQEATDY